MKQYCTQLNLKSFYEIGNMLGKGNFAKVYEARRLNSAADERYALKTIEKKVMNKGKRNFVRKCSNNIYNSKHCFKRSHC